MEEKIVAEEHTRAQDEANIKALSAFVKPVRQLYQCEVCSKKWMKWFFVTKMFRGFPRVRFCGSKCRISRPKGTALYKKPQVS